MKKLFLTSFLFMLATTLFAGTSTVPQASNDDDSFRKAVTELFFHVNDRFSEDAVVKAFESALVANGIDAEEAKAKASTYVKETYLPHVIEIATGVYAKYLTEGQLTKILKLYKSDKGAIAVSHAAEMANTEKGLGKLEGAMANLLIDILAGKELRPIETPECSEVYKAKMHKYCELTDAAKTVDAMITPIKQMAGDQEDAKAMVAKLCNYMRDNAETIILIMGDGIMTEDDLDFFIDVCSTPEGKAVVDASTVIVGEVMDYTLKCVMDFK